MECSSVHQFATPSVKPGGTYAQLADRRARQVLRPFVTQLGEWNQRAARASAMILSRASSGADRSAQFADLRDLLDEVSRSYEEFERVVADEPAQSRIADVRSAFIRLQSTLRRLRAD